MSPSTIVYQRRRNMATTSNSAAQMGDFTFPFTNISNFVSTKLGPNNFLLWRDQMESILVSTDLFGYVIGDVQEPVKQIEINGVLSLNPEWLCWRKIDCFVTSCMKATFTDSVSGDVLGLSTAQEIWAYLEISFKSRFMASKSMLRNQLHNIKKGNLTFLVYLHNIKNIANSLAAIGERVNPYDLTMYVLNVLGREYDSFVTAAHNRGMPFSFAELKPRLLNHEQWLIDQQQDSTMLFEAQIPSAFYSRNGNSSNVYVGNGRGKSKGNFKNGQGQNNGYKNSQGYNNSSAQANGNSGQATGGRRDLSNVDCQI
ncbi:uncharacterized protein LOC113274813 isoform X1 [Papaver somniferum]|uniref:uncharacterized protein LOC113274813 isoform X1 n=2 Tax=Papaver somniferum TaxID=3469 RepID=UPI000E6FB0DC|nr:uncharacterized protein LOC113274813 isoform X1 [Papaver somniferum]